MKNDVTTQAEASDFIGEDLGGECSAVDTQMKCEFSPTATTSKIDWLLVDCNNVFDFDNPSPRMEEYTDEPVDVSGVGKKARFRTTTVNAPRSEFEWLSESNAQMCSLQVTFKATSTDVDLASYKDKLAAFAATVEKNAVAASA